MESLLALVIQFVVLLLATLLMGAIEHLRRWLRAKASVEVNNFLGDIVDRAIWAVEQKGAPLSPFGGKKEAATQIVSDALKSKGIEFTPEQIDAAIEAAVAQAFHYSKHTREPEVTE